MSIEEAKRVTASFASASFVPPPRTISDVRELLEPTLEEEARVRRLRRQDDRFN
jgi:hypothetical protein